MILGFNNRLFVFIFLLLFSCNNVSRIDKVLIHNVGYAQGTTYSIKYFSDNINFKKEIDSILSVIDFSLSIHNDSSVISYFNQSDEYSIINEHVKNVFLHSIYISDITNGFFDCTVYPLVDFWGFLKDKQQNNLNTRIDSNYVISLLQFVSYKNVWIEGDTILLKQHPKIKLDFNGIAQGYSVDVICEFLESEGVVDYLVEVGGEVRGENTMVKDVWRVGIEKPVQKRKYNNYENIVVLANLSLATSGNYRKFKLLNQKKISHHINPKSGFPVDNELLSVSVLSDKCITADGISSAFMVMGIDSIRNISNRHDNIDYLIVYVNNHDTISEMSNGFENHVVF